MRKEESARLLKALSIAGVFVGILLVGLADYFTGFDVNLSVFYALPVIVGVWIAGRWFGVIAAVAAVSIWVLADHLSGHRYASHWIPVWNAFVRVTFLMLFVTGAHYTRRQLQQTRTRSAAVERTLPICACCKRIRDDQGVWTDVEAYIAEHFPAEPSAKVCPDCSKKIYIQKVAPHQPQDAPE